MFSYAMIRVTCTSGAAMKITLFVTVMLATSAFGATTAPSTAPSSDAAAAYRNAAILIQQDKLKEAQAVLLQADRALTKGTKVVDPAHVEVVYASAICSMLQKDYGKAHASLERVRAVKAKDRGFILNDAK